MGKGLGCQDSVWGFSFSLRTALAAGECLFKLLRGGESFAHVQRPMSATSTTIRWIWT